MSTPPLTTFASSPCGSTSTADFVIPARSRTSERGTPRHSATPTAPSPHCVPSEREKFRFASTIFASISTCGVAVSIALTSAVASCTTDGMSLMMSVLVRASVSTEPRLESSRFTKPSTFLTSA